MKIPVYLRPEEEAKRAHQLFLRRGGKWNDPKSPIYQWMAWNSFYKSQKLRYQMGYKDAPLYAISAHIKHGVPLPEWAEAGFLSALRDVISYRVGSWDDVFGKRLKKGEHLAAKRKRRKVETHIYNELVGMVERGETLNFETVGKKYGVGETLAKEYYAAQCKLLGKPRRGRSFQRFRPVE